MLKRVLVVVLAKRVAPPRPSKSTKMASPSSTLAHASNASLASTIAPPAPSPKANNSGFIETLNPSAAPQDVALFFVRRLCARFTARIRLCISAISPPGLNTPLWRRLFRRLGSIHRRCRAMCSFHCAHTHGFALRASLPKSSYLKCTKFRLQ